MSVTTENAPVQGQTTLQENRAGEGVYASLFEKINLAPASHLGDINDFLDDAALSEAPAAERLTAAMQVFMERIRQSGQRVEKLDKTLIDHHIAELDFQISRQLDAVMHHQEFQQVESLWRGLKQLVDNTDYRQNVKTENLYVTAWVITRDNVCGWPCSRLSIPGHRHPPLNRNRYRKLYDSTACHCLTPANRYSKTAQPKYSLMHW